MKHRQGTVARTAMGAIGPVRVLLAATLVCSLVAGLTEKTRASDAWALAATPSTPAPGGAGSDGCLRCHDGIEDMHPGQELSCVDCHGGDPDGSTKFLSHVQSRVKRAGDERTLPEGDDLAYRRFVNPMDLRIVDRTCAECHPDLCNDLRVSLRCD